ncbi:MAG: YihY/virulence factor BrkB family protein [Propionibacteriales bacterium]|nr:YihY/virulence factor BrkB family protein [Propionibacteriales bacterium]
MKDFIANLMARPAVAHLLRANQRFTGRLGNQFGAALTYFSVLSMVPILMFAFSTLGFLLEMQPAVMAPVVEAIVGAVSSGGDTSGPIAQFIKDTLSGWRGTGVVAILTAVYAGSGWIANLKSAVRAQWRPDFDMTEDKANIVVETLVNVLILIAMLLMVLLTFGIASVGTALSDTIVSLLGLDQIPGINFLITFVPVILSVIAGTGLFLFIFWVFPQEPVPFKARLKGSILAAVGLGILQYGTTLLFGVFAGNKAASLFGPVIILMLFFNLFARMTLFIAAWIATTDQPALSAKDEAADFDPKTPIQGPALPPLGVAGDGRRAAAYSARPVDGKVAWQPGDGREFVNQKVAAKSVRAGIGAGWVVGAASGLGLGAAITWVATKISRCR